MSALKLCPTCGAEYPANERFCPRDGTALRAEDAGSDLVGSVIGERYHVLKKLGEGGMGQVYLAEHVKMGRKSAVKVMHPGMVHDADAISRFNREAANACRINHPNVAGIYDFGETADGLIFLAMEFVEGESLTALVAANGALAPVRAARIAKQAADGLTQAHDLGIVHRDLKPDNIMIAKHRDGSDCVKVVDFGIAKAAGSDAQQVTRTGLVVGTPEYMSPEQLAGDRLDGRSDVYSLALVTFNMLTGALPFPSDTAQQAMIMRLTEPPRRLAEMRPGVAWPEAVEAVMARALERDAGLRYQTASEFGTALLDAVGSMPAPGADQAATLVMGGAALPATRVAPGPRAPARRRMPVLIGGGLAVAAAVIGAAVLLSPASSRSRLAQQLPATAVAAVPAGASGVAPGRDSASPSAPARHSPDNADSRFLRTVEPGAAAGRDADISARLPALLEQSTTQDEAASALATARSLIPRTAHRGDLAGLALAQAQALGMLGRDTESCSVLAAARGGAKGTPYAGRITQLIEDGCRPRRR